MGGGVQPIFGIVFEFLGQKSRVNKWSTVGSISGPHFVSNFWRQMWTTYWPSNFVSNCSFLSFICFQHLILPAEIRIFKNNKNNQKTTKENVDHLLSLQRLKCGPLIDPTAYIYIYMYIYIYIYCHLCWQILTQIRWLRTFIFQRDENGGGIRRGWISRFWGAPFSTPGDPKPPKPFKHVFSELSDRKSGALLWSQIRINCRGRRRLNSCPRPIGITW